MFYEEEPKGLACSLVTIQNECLYVVTEAYKATPVHCLEIEMYIPLIDIYFNKQIADFESRFEVIK